MAGSKFEKPCNDKLKLSECTPLFMNAYNLRDAGAVMHSHSQNVVLASLISGSEFRVSHVEMIKGIKKGTTGVSYRYDEELVKLQARINDLTARLSVVQQSHDELLMKRSAEEEELKV